MDQCVMAGRSTVVAPNHDAVRGMFSFQTSHAEIVVCAEPATDHAPEASKVAAISGKMLPTADRALSRVVLLGQPLPSDFRDLERPVQQGVMIALVTKVTVVSFGGFSTVVFAGLPGKEATLADACLLHMVESSLEGS